MSSSPAKNRYGAVRGPWLQELATRFQIVWAAAWGADGNRLLAPLLQFPDLPVIRFPPVPFHPVASCPPSSGSLGAAH
jgi:hypothetical protein